MGSAPVIVWFRLDLRLADNAALDQAVQKGGPVIPLYIWAPEEEDSWPPGSASRWWLHHSLRALSGELGNLGSRLIIRRGPSLESILSLAKTTGSKAVYWNRRYEPHCGRQDIRVKTALVEHGLDGRSFEGALLHEPWAIQNKSGRPYQVFTPYWSACLACSPPRRPSASPKILRSPSQWPQSLSLDSLELEPNRIRTRGWHQAWQPGSRSAQSNLKRFLAESWLEYNQDRNRPDRVGTSRLSAHLHFGEITPRQIWHSLQRHAEKHGRPPVEWRRSQFLAELGWREFAYHLLHHFPHTPTQPLRPEFSRFPWRKDTTWLQSWQQGRTGFPIVDAGMRELWTTGWMHNRVRMIAASFLVKDLLLAWPEGARWFWDTLVDADLANNTLGWQWTAGCGADAAPYFRIFNPLSQGEKYDPEGHYVRRWIPELSRLPNTYIHRPWKTPPLQLEAIGLQLGRDYPPPIVQHAIARESALEAYQKLRKKG